MAKKLATKKKAPPVKRPEPARPNIYDTWIIRLSYIIVIAMPLLVSRISYDQFDLVKLAVFRLLVLAMVFLWLAKFVSKPQSFRWSWREGLLAAFLIMAIISTIFAIHIPTALHGKYKRYEGLLTFITYISMFVVAAQTFTQRRQVIRLFELIGIGGALVSFYGVLQYAGLDWVYWGEVPFELRRSFSTFGNPDLLAGYLVLTFPCAFAAFLERKTPIRWFHGFNSLVITACLFTAMTRSGWLGAIAAFIALVALLAFDGLLRRYSREFGAIAAVLVIAIAAIGIFQPSDQTNIKTKFLEALNPASVTALGRTEIWKAGLLMIKDRPLVGQGLDTYRLASEKFETKTYVKSVRGTTVSDNAHNYPIQLAAGAGPLAAGLLYAFFIAWVIRGIKVSRSLSADSDKLLVIAGVSAVVGYLTTMLLGISIVGAGSVFWLILAGIVGLTRDESTAYNVFNTARLSANARLFIALTMVAVSLVSAALAVSMYLGDVYLVKGLIAAGRSETGAPAYFEKAQSLYPGNGRISSELGQVYIRFASSALQRKDEKSFQFYSEKAVAAFERAVLSEPIEVDYKVFLANAEGTRARYARAIEILAPVLDRRPYSVPANFLYAEFNQNLGRKTLALAHYERVYEISPDYNQVLPRLISLNRELGREEKAAFYEKELKKLGQTTTSP